MLNSLSRQRAKGATAEQLINASAD
jgi:hypothetical protein